jgi:hypothetical protein
MYIYNITIPSHKKGQRTSVSFPISTVMRHLSGISTITCVGGGIWMGGVGQSISSWVGQLLGWMDGLVGSVSQAHVSVRIDRWACALTQPNRPHPTTHPHPHPLKIHSYGIHTHIHIYKHSSIFTHLLRLQVLPGVHTAHVRLVLLCLKYMFMSILMPQHPHIPQSTHTHASAPNPSNLKSHPHTRSSNRGNLAPFSSSHRTKASYCSLDSAEAAALSAGGIMPPPPAPAPADAAAIIAVGLID